MAISSMIIGFVNFTL